MENTPMTPFRLFSGIARLLLLLAPFLAWWWFIAHVDEMTLTQFARLLGLNLTRLQSCEIQDAPAGTTDQVHDLGKKPLDSKQGAGTGAT